MALTAFGSSRCAEPPGPTTVSLVRQALQSSHHLLHNMQRTFQAAVRLIEALSDPSLTFTQRLCAVRASRQHTPTSAVRSFATTTVRQGKPSSSIRCDKAASIPCSRESGANTGYSRPCPGHLPATHPRLQGPGREAWRRRGARPEVRGAVRLQVARGGQPGQRAERVPEPVGRDGRQRGPDLCRSG